MIPLSIVAIRIHAEMKWDNYRQWVCMVSEERQERISRLRNDVDRVRSMISEIVARKCISEALDIPFQSIVFYKGYYGKPFVKLAKPLFLNWSHSGNWILFAMDSEPVGIDVEIVHQVKEMSLARRFFDPQEVSQLERMNPIERKQHFFKLWSLKESYIKWKGTGLNTLLDSFRFIYNDQQELLFSNNDGDSCLFKTIYLDYKHYAAVCISRAYNQNLNIKIFEADEFLKNI